MVAVTFWRSRLNFPLGQTEIAAEPGSISVSLVDEQMILAVLLPLTHPVWTRIPFALQLSD